MPEPIPGWYSKDPCSNYRDAPEWYAPDLIKQIIESPVPHEIGCHTFSHIDMSDESFTGPHGTKNCTHELAFAELQKCQEVSRPFGITLKSFVSPKNWLGNFKALDETGIIAFRGRQIERVLKAPIKENNLWNITETICIEPLLMMRKTEDIQFRIGRYLEEAWKVNGCFHIRSHPWIMGKKVLKKVEPILKHVNDLEKEGKLWVTTMGEIARYCEARENTRIQKIEDVNQIKLGIFPNFDHVKYDYPELSIKVTLPDEKRLVKVEPGDKVFVNEIETDSSIPKMEICLTFSTTVREIIIWLE